MFFIRNLRACEVRCLLCKPLNKSKGIPNWHCIPRGVRLKGMTWNPFLASHFFCLHGVPAQKKVTKKKHRPRGFGFANREF